MEEISVLIVQAQAGDNSAREVLIEKNLGLVHHIVETLLRPGIRYGGSVPDWDHRADQGNR